MLRGEAFLGDFVFIDFMLYSFFFLSFCVYSSVGRTGMAGVPGTASAIFGAVKDVGANVIVISQVRTLYPLVSEWCFSQITFMQSDWISCRLVASILYALLYLRRK